MFVGGCTTSSTLQSKRYAFQTESIKYCTIRDLCTRYDPPVSPGGNPAKSTWSCTARPATLYEIRSRRRTLAYGSPVSQYRRTTLRIVRVTYTNGSEHPHLLRLYAPRVHVRTRDWGHLQLLRLKTQRRTLAIRSSQYARAIGSPSALRPGS